MDRLSPPEQLTFAPVAPSGFGARHNSWAWSMLWWQGRLYVGTNRAWACAERAAIHQYMRDNVPFGRWAGAGFARFMSYPPRDAALDCAARASALPLQAEIWRWTPETYGWERVYQSPRDVPLPGRPGEYVARDVGFRHMASFVDAGGTEALYVSGVNTRFIFGPLPPPRLLRSTDGVVFAPIPQDQGTVLGGLNLSGFRTMVVHEGRMFVIAGKAQGAGMLLESASPAAGNNHFAMVSPPGLEIFELARFNGQLYCGVRDAKRGYAIVKTEATGARPYRFTTVLRAGAFLPDPSRCVISMHVFKDRLYVGTDRPAAEIVRINPDDTWDLIIGTPRQTPAGWKYPLSGLGAGFNNGLNGHIWRMQEHGGRLYVGTWDMSTEFQSAPWARKDALHPNCGFDLFSTVDGQHFEPITTTGFDDAYNYGLPRFASTPYGLFVGTANPWYGLQIWRGTATSTEPAPDGTAPPRSSARPGTGRGWIHTIDRAAPGSPAGHDARPASGACAPPRRLSAEYAQGRCLLSWEGASDTQRVRIWRSRVRALRSGSATIPVRAALHLALRGLLRAVLWVHPAVYLPLLPRRIEIPGVFEEIAEATGFCFEDLTVAPGARYLYFARAETRDGRLSSPSNLVAAPGQAPGVTFELVDRVLGALVTMNEPPGATELEGMRATVRQAGLLSASRDVVGAEALVRAAMATLDPDAARSLPRWMSDDLCILLGQLQRRLNLCDARRLAHSALSGGRGPGPERGEAGPEKIGGRTS